MNLNITGLKVDAKGEGSKGGKIIGHTKSGKPIYASNKKFSSIPHHIILPVEEHKELHKGFTTHDHIEAAQAHHKLMNKHHKIERSTMPQFGKGTGHRFGPGVEAGFTANMHEKQRDRHLKAINAKSMTHLNKAIKAGAIKPNA